MKKSVSSEGWVEPRETRTSDDRILFLVAVLLTAAICAGFSRISAVAAERPFALDLTVALLGLVLGPLATELTIDLLDDRDVRRPMLFKLFPVYRLLSACYHAADWRMRYRHRRSEETWRAKLRAKLRDSWKYRGSVFIVIIIATAHSLAILAGINALHSLPVWLGVRAQTLAIAVTGTAVLAAAIGYAAGVVGNWFGASLLRGGSAIDRTHEWREWGTNRSMGPATRSDVYRKTHTGADFYDYVAQRVEFLTIASVLIPPAMATWFVYARFESALSHIAIAKLAGILLVVSAPFFIAFNSKKNRW